MKQYLLLLTLIVTQAVPAQIQTDSGEKINTTAFTEQIASAMDTLKVPAMLVAVINKGKIVFTKVLGWTDVDSRKPVTSATLFEAASLSKPAFVFRSKPGKRSYHSYFLGVDAWSMELTIITLNNTITYWHGGNNLGYTASYDQPRETFGLCFF